MRRVQWLALAIAAHAGWTGIAAAENMSAVLAKVAAPQFRYSLLVPVQSGSVARLLQFEDPEQGGQWRQALRHPEQLGARTGLDLKMIHSVFQIGSGPGAVTIVRTRPGGTDRVAEALTAREFAPSNEARVRIYARGADLAVSIRSRDAFDPFGGLLGQSSRIAIFPDRLVEARAWDPLRNALHQLGEEARPSAISYLSPALSQHRTVMAALAALAEAAFADGGEILSAHSDFLATIPAFLFSKVSAHQAGFRIGEALSRARGDGAAACADLRSAAGQGAPPADALPLHMSQLIAVGRKGPQAQLAISFWFQSRQSAKSAANMVQAKLETAARETSSSAHPEIEVRVIDQQEGQAVLTAILRVRTAAGELVDTADRLLRESTRGQLSRSLAPCV